jgi:hypothetical protein
MMQNHFSRSTLQRNEFFVVLLLVVVAAWLRIDYLLALDSVIDSDEAIVGLMARHFLAGKEMPTFYYGQHYMGSLEAYAVALMFALFGESSLVLRATPLLFALATIPLLYLFVRKISGPFAATVSTSLLAVAPPVLLIWSTKARGGFIEILFLGALAWWLASRWYLAQRPPVSGACAVGLVLGIGWWTNTQIIYFMLPLGLVFLYRFFISDGRFVREKWRDFAVQTIFAFTSFILGGLPYWIYNFQNEFASFGIASAVGPADALEHFVGLLLFSLPILFGAMRFWESQEIVFFGNELIWGSGVILGLFVLLLLLPQSRRRIWEISPVGLQIALGICIIGMFTIFSVSSFGYLVQAPRYLLPLYLPVFALLGVLLGKIHNRSVPIAYVLWIGLLSWNLFAAYGTGRALPGEPFVFDGERVQRQHHELIRWLEDSSVEAVKTNYWIGYRLSFETQEQTIFKIFGEPEQIRIPEYEEQVQALLDEGKDVPYVLLPRQAELVSSALKAQGYAFQQVDVSGYRILYALVPPTPLDVVYPKAELTANSNGDNAHLAFDRDIATRWGSGRAATPGMQFEVAFSEPQTQLQGIRVLLGQWSHDYPRGLRVVALGSDGQEQILLTGSQKQALLYYLSDDIEFRFKPLFPIERIHFQLLQGHHLFDWSIAEIELLRTASVKGEY